MAAAYAAIVYVTHLMEQIQLYHTRRRIFLDKQLRQIESLRKKVSFLQDFLEGYPYIGGSKETEHLETKIKRAAYAVEDVIESYMVDDIHQKICLKRKKNKKQNLVPSTSHGNKKSSNYFSQALQKVTEEMDFIKKEVVKIKEKSTLDDHKPRDLELVAPSGPPFIGKDTIVGLEYDLYQIMDKLTGQHSNLQVIPIIGMGGIGKTTLAKLIYDNPRTVQHFDIRGWITISHEYNVRDLLLGLLCEMKDPTNKIELESCDYHELGHKIYQHLLGMRYLIIMDDMWSIKTWDMIKSFFPNINNRSRIMVTTRISDVAEIVGSSCLHKINLLDEEESWSLLCKKIFAQEGCPREMEEVGKKIAKTCKGLPLSLTVIGGLLAKSKMTQEYWEYVAKYTSTAINSEDDDRCLKILSLSYTNLPIYLKPCFLYLGVFPENCEIHVSELIKLWVSEGLLKPHRAKSLEEVAKDYLKDLIDRNLVYVSKFGCTGNIKYCKIHDLLRDLCLREARKERFLYVANAHSSNISQAINGQRRVAIYPSMSNDIQVLNTLQSTSFVRSLICFFYCELAHLLDIKLFRVLEVPGFNYREALFQLVNSRYLRVHATNDNLMLPSSVHLLWNLQVLIITGYCLNVVAPSEIWKMPRLKHLMINGISLPDPPDGLTDEEDDNITLKNLQTLSCVHNFRCTEEVLKRIPNIKKLNIKYYHSSSEHDKGLSHYYLNNLGRLNKLQSLRCEFPLSENWPIRSDLLENLKFPHSLRSLRLHNCSFDWEDMTIKIGSLPNLEKLKLIGSFRGEEWNPVEGQFLRLKFLGIYDNDNLIDWAANSSHFPCLEHLVLKYMNVLKEIPSGIGEIHTLRLIQLDSCNDSTVTSAMNILEEQHNFGNEDLRIEGGELFDMEFALALVKHILQE